MKVTEGQHIIILHSAPSFSASMSAHACMLLLSRVWDLQEEDPPLFCEESIGYLSKRFAICNVRQMSSNEITGIEMSETEQRDGKELQRQTETSLKKPSEHLSMLNRADPHSCAVCTLCLFIGAKALLGLQTF